MAFLWVPAPWKRDQGFGRRRGASGGEARRAGGPGSEAPGVQVSSGLSLPAASTPSGLCLTRP